MSNRVRKEIKKPKNPLKQKRFRHNWRTDMLAVPKGRRDELEAFRFIKMKKDFNESEISLKQPAPDAKSLTEKSKKFVPIEHDDNRYKRMLQMSVYPARIYQAQKKIFGDHFGEKFNTRMNNKIKVASQSIYHEYDRARVALKRRKLQRRFRESRIFHKPTTSKSQRILAALRRKRPHAERLKEALEWCANLALPKKVYQPPKIDRGKTGDIDKLMIRVSKLARPKHMYKRPSQDSLDIENRCKVKRAALKYIISDNVAQLAQPLVRIIFEPRPLGKVVPEALTAKPTPRILELAVPKPKAASNDNDYNEEAFQINPNALKYKPSPRILELAKPRERE